MAEGLRLVEAEWASGAISMDDIYSEPTGPEPTPRRSRDAYEIARRSWVQQFEDDVEFVVLSSSLALVDEKPLPPASELAALLRVEPIEDGVSHPADAALNTAEAPLTARWLGTAFSRVERDTKSKAALLRCISRVDRSRVDDAIVSIVAAALRDPDVELREAAIRAAEQWEDSELVPLLEAHDEPVGWMKVYLAGVLTDLKHA